MVSLRMVVEEVITDSGAQMALAEKDDLLRHSLLMERTKRSGG
jgi:hypothetical protein